MDIYKSIDKVKAPPSSVITFGTFDGLHLGHVQILNHLKAKAAINKVKSAVVTFDPHPKQILESKFYNKVIMPIEDRLDFLKIMNIDITLVIPFNEKFSKIGGQEFMADIIIPLFNPLLVIVGYDHHFGNKKSGNIHLLNQMKSRNKFNVKEVGQYRIDNEIVNSTYIRKCLQDGLVSKVEKLLGRPFSIKGEVVKGSGRGKLIGFPTANISPLYKEQIIPKTGVYCVLLQIHGIYHQGMCNIGLRPTFDSLDKEVIEVHVFNKDDVNLYGVNVRVIFVKYIRDEKRFESVEDLIQQLELDRQKCLSENKRSEVNVNNK